MKKQSNKTKSKNSAFGYFGSKHRIAKKIAHNLPPHHAWVEAFCGSAAITLTKHPAPIEIINDLDGEIINFFQQLRENSSKLCQAVALTPYARQELINARLLSQQSSSLERARRFLISSMMAINGVFGEEEGGFSCSQSYSRSGKEARVSRWCNLPERLERIVDRLKMVRIENKDARDLIKMFIDRPATLMYLDPPYLGERSRGYSNDANDEEFHEDLLKLACRAKGMVLISGYESPLYTKILTPRLGWEIVRIETHTQGINGKKSARTEILWKNKQYVLAECSGRVPIVLSDQEKKNGKVNPSR